ncbi:MAG: TldD/PmbA family protein [Elusimicrobiota bacterium]|jgi:TldD protein
MFKLCEKAIDIAASHKAAFGDIRIIETRSQSLAYKNGEVGVLDDGCSLGFGVRVLLDGAWGFASSNEVTGPEIERVSLLAIEIARASARLKKGDVRLAPEPVYRDTWQTPYLIDPFAVSIETKLDLLARVDAVLRKDRKVKSSTAFMNFIREHQYHATTEGSRIEQTLLTSGAGCSVDAVDKGEVQTRSYPATHGGQSLGLGYELIESLRMLDHAERVRDEAVALLKAPECPSGKLDLIIGDNQLALQIHESVGHATELDRVLGYEESYAGSSFATLEKYGNFRYGSPIVNLVADATVPTGLATAGWDDDGVKAQRWHIVEGGVLKGYMTNREFCHAVGDTRSRGCSRAEGFGNIPITRICNLSLMPGDWGLDDLVRDTKDGIMMENNRLWSIDQKRVNFQFGCEIGWLIKNGRRTKMVRNPTYQGITPEFWNSCDAICNARHWKLWGVPNCGKGQPGQTAMMCHGSSPARFRGVTVGVRPK